MSEEPLAPPVTRRTARSPKTMRRPTQRRQRRSVPTADEPGGIEGEAKTSQDQIPLATKDEVGVPRQQVQLAIQQQTQPTTKCAWDLLLRQQSLAPRAECIGTSPLFKRRSKPPSLLLLFNFS